MACGSSQLVTHSTLNNRNMTVIQQTTEIARSATELYAFLLNCNNHEQLMPENVYNWSSTETEAKFTIQNMAKLSLKIGETVEDQLIVFVPAEEAPFHVQLKWQLESLSDHSTKVSLILEAELNMMLKMIASGPLQKLVDFQIHRLNIIFA